MLSNPHFQGAYVDNENLTDLLTFTLLTTESAVTEQAPQTINSNEEGESLQPTFTHPSTSSPITMLPSESQSMMVVNIVNIVN